MEKIEIRQNNKTFLIVLVFIVGVQIFFIHQIYFVSNVENTTIKVAFGFVILGTIYGLYLPIKRLIRNEPILTLSRSEITIIEKNKPVSYGWLQVHECRIERDFDGDAKYLILETTEGKKKVIIASLELDSDEIEELINEYKNASRSPALSNQTQ